MGIVMKPKNLYLIQRIQRTHRIKRLFVGLPNNYQLVVKLQKAYKSLPINCRRAIDMWHNVLV